MPHISPTQIAMWHRCPMQWYHRYALNLRIAPGIAMIRGSGVDAARTLNLTQKITSGTDLDLATVQDAARDSVNGAFLGEVALEDGVGPQTAKGRCVDGAVQMAGVDWAGFQTVIKPLHVQLGLKAVLTLGSEIPPLDLIGYLDLVDADLAIRDLKTTAKTPPATAAQTSLQLLTYDVLARANGTAPRRLQLDYVVDHKGGPVTTTREAVFSDAAREGLLRRIGAIVRSIRAGAFPPCEPGAWVCSRKWCGYCGRCPYYDPAVDV